MDGLGLWTGCTHLFLMQVALTAGCGWVRVRVVDGYSILAPSIQSIHINVNKKDG